jgi:ubiquinone/menaquinone biosynthesis C-methylase UbiE
MTPSDTPPTEQGTYFSDAENAGEMARLIKQARFTTKGWGGPFPNQLDLSAFHNVLDLACGPGEWVQDVAKANPTMQVTGVDLSQTMIAFANDISREISNAHFQVMDITRRMDFPDNSFDFINSHFIFGFMKTSAWPTLLQECKRILRPGGAVILNEPEFPLSNSLPFEQLGGFFAQAMRKAGQSFSPDGRHFGITLMLKPLLADAGFERLQQEGRITDISAGTELHTFLYEDYRTLFHLVQPFLLTMSVTTADEFKRIYHQMLHDLNTSSFRAFGCAVRAWGYKAA